MQCPQCHNELEGAPKFCNRCGSKIEPVLTAPPTEQTPDPFLGKVLGGKYKITKLLGEGGMGAVYLGEQTLGGTARKVAIKTLHSHLSRDPKILARFERECGTVAELSHPNTIQLYDFGKTDDDILYMVMEFVQGESLAAILEKQHSLDPARVEHILSQICDALGEAHALGIIHRDLKPDNIVLTERAKDWVKVLDFGIAKRSEAADKDEQKLTQQGTVLGTPPYMSPEQFTGKPIDNRSDIYSVGVMAYEMLAGHLPFNANTPWEWATQHMTVPPQPLPATTPNGTPIPEAMRNAVLRALEKEPEHRFATTKDFFEAFSQKGAASASPVAGYAAPVPYGSGEGSQKGKTQIGAPLDAGGAPYGTPGGPPVTPATPLPMGAPAGAHYGTPDAGAYAMPTPVGIPHAPPRAEGGGGKGLLLGIAAVVGIASVGAVLYAVAGHRNNGAATTITTSDSVAPTEATLSSTPVASDSAPVFDDKGIDPLKGGSGASGGRVTPPPHKDDAGKAVPGGSTTPTATTSNPKPPPSPPPPANDPLPCQKARQMQASGLAARQQVLFQQLRLACFNAGGRI